MASIIRVKRSTGNAAPSTINYGELAVTIANGTQGNKGGRLFVGDNTNPDPDPIVIGGVYYTDMMQNTPGTVAGGANANNTTCLLYTSPSPRDPKTSRMPSSA